jgi:hypothetical protein
MTSSSSGHSSDDQWYELLEPAEPDVSVMVRESPPPPLPARLGSGVGSAFQQVPPKQMQHGAKLPVQTSHSLPLSSSGNYSLPSSAPSRYNPGGEYESSAHHDFKLGEKVTCLKPSGGEARPVPRPTVDYLVTRTPKVSWCELALWKW